MFFRSSLFTRNPPHINDRSLIKLTSKQICEQLGVKYVSGPIRHIPSPVYSSSRRFPTFPRPLTLHDYYDNLSIGSAFLTDVAVVMQEAEVYLSSRIQSYKISSPSYKLAITLDIDDTSLSHYRFFKKNNFYTSPSMIESCYQKATSPAIMPVLNFYKKAQDGNVSIFFITARKPLNPQTDLRFVTEKNLHNAGFINHSGLFLPAGNDANIPTVKFKTRIRESIEGRGLYKIILNIGDQQSDLDGAYAEKTIKIPNYLYDAAKQLLVNHTKTPSPESNTPPRPS